MPITSDARVYGATKRKLRDIPKQDRRERMQETESFFLQKKQTVVFVENSFESVNAARRFRDDVRSFERILQDIQRNHCVANLHPVHIFSNRSLFSLQNPGGHVTDVSTVVVGF